MAFTIVLICSSYHCSAEFLVIFLSSIPSCDGVTECRFLLQVHAHENRDFQETDIDGEEWDKVREMLGRILAPQVVRIGPTEADIAWQQLDTSEVDWNYAVLYLSLS